MMMDQSIEHGKCFRNYVLQKGRQIQNLLLPGNPHCIIVVMQISNSIFQEENIAFCSQLPCGTASPVHGMRLLTI